jgi:hypothetical protein
LDDKWWHRLFKLCFYVLAVGVFCFYFKSFLWIEGAALEKVSTLSERIIYDVKSVNQLASDPNVFFSESPLYSTEKYDDF